MDIWVAVVGFGWDQSNCLKCSNISTNAGNIRNKKTFGTADMVNRCVIFNIGGGKYRLVVRVNFVGQRMWIKYLLPHNEYEKLDLKEDSKCRP